MRCFDDARSPSPRCRRSARFPRLPCPARAARSLPRRSAADRDPRRPRRGGHRRPSPSRCADERRPAARHAIDPGWRDRRAGAAPRGRSPAHRPLRGGSAARGDGGRPRRSRGTPRARCRSPARPVQRGVPGTRAGPRIARPSPRGAAPHPHRQREPGSRSAARADRRQVAGRGHPLPRRDRPSRDDLRRRAALRRRRDVAARAHAPARPSVADLVGRPAPLHPHDMGRHPRRPCRRPAAPDRCRHRDPRRGGARAPPAVRRRRRWWRWGGTRAHADTVVRWRRGRARGVLVRFGLDAAGRPHRQEHVCLARPAVAHLWPRYPDTRRDPRRGARHARPLGRDRAVAHRAVGALEGVRADQAAARQPGCRRVGLFARRLHDRRGPRRRGCLHEPGRSRVVARDPPGQRHGPQPHGDRLALGHRAPGVVPVTPRATLSGLQLHGPRPLAGSARRDRPRGPLLGRQRRGGGLQAHRPRDRGRALRLSRQRRHELPLE